MITFTLGSPLIRGPEPMVAVKPIGSWVKFTCVVNKTELPPGTTFFWGIWIVDGNVYRDAWKNGSLAVTSTIERPVTINYIRPVQVLCVIILKYKTGGLIEHGINSHVSTLIAYGKIQLGRL